MSPRSLLVLWSAFLLAPTCGRPDATVFQSIVDAAGIGGTVTIEATYQICQPVHPWEEQTWEGTGRLVRCAVPRSYLTTDAKAGETTLSVSSSAGFRVGVGHRVGVGEGPETNGEGPCKPHWIQAISPTTITFSYGLCQDYAAGTLVYVDFPMVEVFDADGVTMRGVTIDGAEARQPAYHGTSRQNLHIRYSDDLLIEDVRIVNAWGEAVLILWSEKPVFRGVEFANVRCGGIHVGRVTDLLVRDSTFRNIGTEGAKDICGHAEGAFTYSLNNYDVEIRDSCFENVHNPYGAIGRMNLNANAFLHMEGNLVCGAEHFFAARYSNLDGPFPVNPPGAITAINNSGNVSSGLFDLPSGLAVDFYATGNAEAGPCRCE